MEIKTDDYQVSYDTNAHIIICSGALRLASAVEYAPITEMLSAAAAAQPSQLVLDLRGLNYLNSFGINILAKFVINVRQRGASELRLIGSRSVPWQGKSLLNLQRLMPKLEIEME